MHRGMKNSVWWTSLLQQVTKFRSSYSFRQLLRILLRAVNLFSFSHIVSSDSSFNIYNALYFVKYPSWAAGGLRAAGWRHLVIPEIKEMFKSSPAGKPHINHGHRFIFMLDNVPDVKVTDGICSPRLLWFESKIKNHFHLIFRLPFP